MISIPIREKIERLHLSPDQLNLTIPERGVYPSVSTVLSETGDKSGLEKWRAKVGEEEATRITEAAAERGRMMHSIIESY